LTKSGEEVFAGDVQLNFTDAIVSRENDRRHCVEWSIKHEYQDGVGFVSSSNALVSWAASIDATDHAPRE
jgi:hypothetical protein